MHDKFMQGIQICLCQPAAFREDPFIVQVLQIFALIQHHCPLVPFGSRLFTCGRMRFGNGQVEIVHVDAKTGGVEPVFADFDEDQSWAVIPGLERVAEAGEGG